MGPGAAFERRRGLPRRVSAFTESGLFDDASPIEPPPARCFDQSQFFAESSSETSTNGEEERDAESSEWEDVDSDVESTKPAKRGVASPVVTVVDTDIAAIAPRRSSRLYRLGVLAFILAVSVPMLQNTPLLGKTNQPILGAKGGPIPNQPHVDSTMLVEDVSFWKREDTPTSVCKRWSHQCACDKIYVRMTTNQDISCCRERYSLHVRRTVND